MAVYHGLNLIGEEGDGDKSHLMKNAMHNTSNAPNGDVEFADWRARYDASIAAYEAMSERRRERKLVKLAQAKRDEVLRREDEIDRRYLETHPSCDPIEMYFRHREETARAGWKLLALAICATGCASLAYIAVAMLRQMATETINRIEKLLWRTQRKLSPCTDTRSEAERERRKILRRTTLAPQPTPDDIRRAWLKADGSCRDIIAFGAMVHDLECYVDNSLGFDECGNIVGRANGILGWLRENVPELAARYKTIMRYKSIAKRCRQFLGLVDPEPLDADDARLAVLLTACPATQKDVCERLDAALSRQSMPNDKSGNGQKRFADEI